MLTVLPVLLRIKYWTLVYRTLFYVNKHGSFKLSKNSLVLLAHPVYRLTTVLVVKIEKHIFQQVKGSDHPCDLCTYQGLWLLVRHHEATQSVRNLAATAPRQLQQMISLSSYVFLNASAWVCPPTKRSCRKPSQQKWIQTSWISRVCPLFPGSKVCSCTRQRALDYQAQLPQTCHRTLSKVTKAISVDVT